MYHNSISETHHESDFLILAAILGHFYDKSGT